MSTQSQVNDLLHVTSRLITVLEREVALLRSVPSTELEQLQQEKSTLTAAYESQARSLAGQPRLLEALEPVLRSELARVSGRFQSALAANERALRAARDTSQRVLQAIADEIDKTQRENAGYSSSGQTASAARPGSAPPVSIAVDKRL